MQVACDRVFLAELFLTLSPKELSMTGRGGCLELVPKPPKWNYLLHFANFCYHPTCRGHSWTCFHMKTDSVTRLKVKSLAKDGGAQSPRDHIAEAGTTCGGWSWTLEDWSMAFQDKIYRDRYRYQICELLLQKNEWVVRVIENDWNTPISCGNWSRLQEAQAAVPNYQ